jgi:uncharacterized protein
MTNYFIIPGFGGSGPKHWQTFFEKQGTNYRRIEQKDWNNPDLKEWSEIIENLLSDFDPKTVVLIGHSLGCHAITNWAVRHPRNIKAALLVAPPDLNVLDEQLHTRFINTMITDRLRFKSMVVASTNDQWATIEKSKEMAECWGSRFVNIGAAGHINAQSGHYEWKQGLTLLKMLEYNNTVRLLTQHGEH